MKTYLKTIPNYWKYVQTKSTFPNPTLSSNGTLGGSSFAVSAASQHQGYAPWKAFADGWDVIWHSAGGLPCWYIFYNPVPLQISYVQILNDPEVGCGGGQFQGSNDGSNWNYICDFSCPVGAGGTWGFSPNNSTPYKYFRFWFTSSWYSSFIVIRRITLTSQSVVTTVVEGTESDYDFITNEYECKCYKDENNNYKMMIR
jgi:hypothetical protein